MVNRAQPAQDAASAGHRYPPAIRPAGRSDAFAAGRRAALGEELKLLSVVIVSGWRSSMTEGNQPAYAQGIAAMFRKQMGLGLTTLRLTEAGLQGR